MVDCTMYMVLDYLLDCRFNGCKPNPDLMTPRGLNEDGQVWALAMSRLFERGLVDGHAPSKSGTEIHIWLSGLDITDAGMEFLMLDPTMNEVRRCVGTFQTRRLRS